MGRSIVAVVAGLVAGVLAIFLVETAGHLLYPPPAGVDFKDPDAIAKIMAQLPAGALILVLFAWAVGAASGGFVAAHIATRAKINHALLSGAILMAFGILTLVMIPHPLWFMIVGAGLYLPAAWLGGWLAIRAAA